LNLGGMIGNGSVSFGRQLRIAWLEQGLINSVGRWS